MYYDCFAKQTKCAVLKEMLCENGECPFYKPREQYEADLAKYPRLNDKKKTVKKDGDSDG